MQSWDVEDTRGSWWIGFLAGAGIGAAYMYLTDPNSGARRRAMVRDKAIHIARKTADGFDAASRDLSHRAYGTWASARGRMSRADVPDDILVERVRAKLGRYVSHPHAIDVRADGGHVSLRGKILKGEVKPLVGAIRRVRGVYGVDNQLEQHETRDSVPALQGGRPRHGESWDVFTTNWSPATRALVATIGSAVAAYGAARRDLAGAVASIAGAGCFVRAATNFETSQLTGYRAGRRAVDIEKTIHIDAPVEAVFDFWTNLENFPHYMRNVIRVSPAEVEGQYHWRIAGPGHVPIEFDAVVTRLDPSRILAWKTLEGSPVAHAGVIHFEPDPGGGSRVHIQFSYNPPAGAIGHAMAKLLGDDPKAKMDGDLARLKTMIETGNPPRDAAQPLPRSPEALM
jgi:uncharacterized membrane protein